MKKIVATVLALALLICAAACAQTINRIPGVDLQSEQPLMDGTMRVSISAENVDETSISPVIWEEMRFDIVDVANLKAGDELETPNGNITVNTLSREGGELYINGGYENGGVTLWADDEGNSWAMVYYEDIEMAKAGQVKLPLADIVAISIYTMNEDLSPNGNGYDTMVVPAARVAGEIARIVGMFYADELTAGQTTIMIENGQVTAITIDYQP